MKYCSNCGAALADDAVKCDYCGTPTAPAAPANNNNGYYGAPNNGSYNGSYEGGYNAPNNGYGAPNNGYGAPNGGYGAPNNGYGAPNGGYNNGYGAPNYNYGYQPVPHYSNGGLIAWSIVTLLLCTIPGIVALINACGINSAVSVEEQQKKISRAKTWCIVGTVLGVVLCVLEVIGALAN